MGEQVLCSPNINMYTVADVTRDVVSLLGNKPAPLCSPDTHSS